MFAFKKKSQEKEEQLDDVPPPPKLTRTFSETPEHREAQLLEYVTEIHKDKNNVNAEEGLALVLEYGVNVLFRVLASNKSTAKPFGNKGYFALNSICFSICSQAEGPDNSGVAYQFIVNQMERFVREEVVALLLDTSLVGLPVVATFSRAWEANKSMTKWMQLLFQHMDKGYIPSAGEFSITCVGMSLFREIGLEGTRERVRSAVLDLIETEREGGLVDRAQLKSCIEVFIVLGLCDRERIKTVTSVAALLKKVQDLTIYTDEFVGFFLSATKAYYEKKAAQWRDDPVPQYLLRVEEVLASERERADYLLHPSTEHPLRLLCVDTLLNKPQAELVSRPASGMMALLNDRKSDDLKRMFDLFTKEGVEAREMPMAVVFEQYCADEGRKLLAAKRAEVAAVEASGKKEGSAFEGAKLIVALMELHERTEGMVSDLFGKTLAFQKALRNAFQVVMNEPCSKKYAPVEYLVAYLDAVLKGKDAGGEKLDEPRMEERLNASMRLFDYLHEKDLYAELYRDYLAKRLLNNKVSSLDMEKHLITALKVSQGPPFTSKIEGMLTDFSLVEASVAEYAEYVKERRRAFEESGAGGAAACSSNPLVSLGGGGGSSSSSSSSGGGDSAVESAELARACDSRVHVLSGNYWPTHANIDGLLLAPPMTAAVNCFERYYAQHHTGKNLLWKHSLGDAEVYGRFTEKKSYTMTVTTLQAVALLFVGELGSVTTQALAQDHMNVSVEIVKRVLHSLSCGKYKIFTKTGPGEKNKIDVADEFRPNKDFKNKVARFSVPMASLENATALKEKVKEDRSYMIDAALVRTMKARKRMAHSSLVSEVMSQLTQFKPESSLVKRRIASLIEREYIERSAEDHGVYSYLA